MLIEIGGRIVNTDHIVSAKDTARSGSVRQVVATLTTGKTFTISESATIALEDLCGTVVPAPAGFTLIEAFVPTENRQGPKVNYWETALIAFRVLGGVRSPIPIGLRGEPQTTNGSEYAVIQPDGRCVGWEMTWPDREAFLAHCENLAERNRTSLDGRALASQNAPPPAPTSAPSEPKESDDATTPLLDLRARIQAEPIAAPFADAPWRAGRDLVAVLDELIAKHPSLHANGIGSPKPDPKWELGTMERERAVMMSAGNVKAFEASLRFLSHAGRQFAQQRVNRNRTSYSWKHAVGRIMGVYVPNGMLIAAAYALGFTVEPGKESQNACINLSEKAIALDPGKGMT